MDDVALSCCKSCPVDRESCLPRNTEDCEIAVVLDWPSEQQDKHQSWYKGKRGGQEALLVSTIEAAGYDPLKIYFCSALNCRPNKDKKAMHKKAMLACKRRLVTELKSAGVKKVLCCGPIGYSALMSSEKLLAITKVRGRWKQAYGMSILATLPPGFVFGKDKADYFRDIAFDIQKFFSTDGPEPYPDVEIWMPENLKEMEEAFKFLESNEWMSCDIETEGFSPIFDKLTCLGFAVLDENKVDSTAVVINRHLLEKKKTWRLFAKLLNNESNELVFHNGKFDLQFLKQNLLNFDLPYNPHGIHDTMLLHYLLDERPIGKYKSHGLETIVRCRFDAPDYGIDMKKWIAEWKVASDFDKKEMADELHVYSGLDCYYTARLFPVLWNELIKEDKDCDTPMSLLDLYEEVIMPASNALAEVEHHGITLDIPMYEDLKVKLDKEALKLLKKIQKTTGIPDFNPGSPKQVKEYIYDTLELPFGVREENGKVYHSARRGGLQEGPTAAPVLKSLAYKYPEHKQIVDDICQYRNLTKNIGTYVNGLLTRVDQDNKLRTSLNIPGTATGRLSSSNPNLQNVPDASHTGIEIRGGFMADEGNVIIEADYKQLEVRIAAWLADDDNMRAVFESGRDPHQEIAFSIYKKPKEEITHYMRWLAKNILFGLLYGRGAESVAEGPEQEDIAARGGERWGKKDVEKFFASLLADWKDFAAWQANQKKMGYRDGEIRMPTGRRRRFAFIPKHDGGFVGRASFNNPIQGTASDFTLYALIKLHEQLPEGAYVILTVHDSIMIECREDMVDEVVELVERIMEEETLFDIDVPLKADIDVSKRWGEEETAMQHKSVVEIEKEKKAKAKRKRAKATA